MKSNQNYKTIKNQTKHFTQRFCEKGNRPLRRINKSEIRYRIMENTMRGYFNYSI